MSTRQRNKKCRRCGETKKSAENFRVMPSGQRYRFCNSCVADPIQKEKLKCKSCYKSKTKNCFTKSDNICNNCIENPKTNVSVKKNKKDDGIIDRNIMSFEYQNKQRLSAEEALIKAKQREKQIINNGGRYTQRGVRAYVLKRI